MAQFCLFFWLPIVTSIVAFHFVRRLLCNTLQHIRVGGFYFAFPARKYNRKFIDVSAGTDISDGPAGRRWILLFVLFELNGLCINETKQNLLAGLWVSARSVTDGGPSRNTPMLFCNLKCTLTLFACVAREAELELNWSWASDVCRLHELQLFFLVFFSANYAEPRPWTVVPFISAWRARESVWAQTQLFIYLFVDLSRSFIPHTLKHANLFFLQRWRINEVCVTPPRRGRPLRLHFI